MGAAESTEANPITAFNNLGLVHHRCLRPNCPTRCDRQRCARADHPACRHPPCLDPTRCVWTPYRVVAMPPDARLDQVYVPSGFSDAGESEPDMDPPSQRAVTTDPANEVLNGIYIGSMATALDHASLKKQGITHILNMSDYEDCPTAYAPSDFDYLILNVPDQLEIRRYLHGAIHFLREGRRRGGGVLVHCKDPSGALSISAILGYLIAFQGLKLEDAIKLVDRKRHVALTPDVLHHLHEYEIGLKQVLSNTRQYSSHHPEIKKEKQEEEMKPVDEANIIRHEWSPNSEVLGFSGKELCRAPNPEGGAEARLLAETLRSAAALRDTRHAFPPPTPTFSAGPAAPPPDAAAPQAPTEGKAGREPSETEQIHRQMPDLGFAVYTHMPSITKQRERAYTGQDAWQPGMGDSCSVSHVPGASSKPELHQYLASLEYWNRQPEAKTFIPLPSEKPSKTDVTHINDIGVPGGSGQLLVEGLAPYRRYAPVHAGDQIWQDRNFWTRPNSTLHIIA